MAGEARMRNARQTPYGALLRSHRSRTKQSLRDVAAMLGISHAYLADVETGACGPLDRHLEPALIKCVKGLRQRDLDAARAASRPVNLTLRNTPVRYTELLRELARRIDIDDLRDEQIAQIRRILAERSPSES